MPVLYTSSPATDRWLPCSVLAILGSNDGYLEVFERPNRLEEFVDIQRHLEYYIFVGVVIDWDVFIRTHPQNGQRATRLLVRTDGGRCLLRPRSAHAGIPALVPEVPRAAEPEPRVEETAEDGAR